MLNYFSRLTLGKTALWCYLIWYVITVVNHFDASPSIWLNSIGISAVIGTALVLSVSAGDGTPDRWQTFRLFLMPFCVSSFSSLIKDQGFVLIFPPSLRENLASFGACAIFLILIALLKRYRRGK
jgi:hypothetical protein